MKIRSILSVLMAVLLSVTCFAGCTREDGFPVTIGGAELTKSPERVVVLSEQAASTICALGYKSYLVGAPSEFLETDMAGVTEIGETMYVDFDTVYELEPDVVITPGELTSSLMESMKLRDITVINLPTPMTYDEVAPYYEALSKMFLGEINYTEAYDAYIGETERIMAELKTANSGLNKKTAVFVEEGFVVTGDTIAGQAMEKCGITNIGAEDDNYMMSAVQLVEADPEVIFCPKGLSTAILETEAYKNITAIKNAAVYEIDVASLVYAGEGFAATLQEMSNYLNQ